MSAQDHIDRLDVSLARNGEDVWLIRTVGNDPNKRDVRVKCRAKVFGATAEQLIANVPATDLNVIISPTQITNAQWPGGQMPQLGPNAIDPRIPVANQDKMIARGRTLNVKVPDPILVDNVLVRINLRIG